MDAVDAKYGHANPLEVDDELCLATAMQAILTGLNIDNRECIEEGAAMLQDFIRSRYGREFPGAKY